MMSAAATTLLLRYAAFTSLIATLRLMPAYDTPCLRHTRRHADAAAADIFRALSYASAATLIRYLL